MFVNESRSINCGNPHSSVLVPVLWNLFYDDLPRLHLAAGPILIGFADDITLVAVTHTTDLLEELVNPDLQAVNVWMSQRGLQLAHHTTKAVMLTRKWVYRINIQKRLCYLGVELDTRRSYTPHIRTVAWKAVKVTLAIGRLMPNVGGPSHPKRAFLSSVVMNLCGRHLD